MAMSFKAYGHVPDNFWLGTTAVDLPTAMARIPPLLKINSPNLWLSLEPLLGPIELDLTLAIEHDSVGGEHGETGERFSRGNVSWVIVGGESGANKRPMDLAWAIDLRDQCELSGVPYFFKQIDKVQPVPKDLNITEMPYAIE